MSCLSVVTGWRVSRTHEICVDEMCKDSGGVEHRLPTVPRYIPTGNDLRWDSWALLPSYLHTVLDLRNLVFEQCYHVVIHTLPSKTLPSHAMIDRLSTIRLPSVVMWGTKHEMELANGERSVYFD